MSPFLRSIKGISNQYAWPVPKGNGLAASSKAIGDFQTGSGQNETDDLAKVKEVYHIPLERFIYLVLGNETGKESSPIVLWERFNDAEIMTILEMGEKEPELKNVLGLLTLMAEKDRKRAIQHIINFINVEKTLILSGPLAGLEAFLIVFYS